MKSIKKLAVLIIPLYLFAGLLYAEIKHNGLTYGTIKSPITGKVWLDRNLGASQACTSFDDKACYGDYYQWGRAADGHEKTNSKVVSTQAKSSSNVGHGDFIKSPFSGERYDWAYEVDKDGSIREANWNPCPKGYKVPTSGELIAERYGIYNKDDAYNKLKLPLAGYRSSHLGSFNNQGSHGYLWSSSAKDFDAYYIDFDSSKVALYDNDRALGLSIRCIED
ncbi:hypothetical protein AMRN_2605 [Malaciobacter marinus]|uniref:Uncharacterized protein n=1 Tax=Malaciobacter marinus TaxID=505249 RepID=A0A347TNX5_9BACT|nr:FISUMP domain-containing protein [Malaciobacter marinus]AXX88303.1 hypothetical protein AMRN_2605 [Malaciobacter marinus]PHO14614.1 hypothetical protein CPH92_10950 [Malaciobacter marinus]